MYPLFFSVSNLDIDFAEKVWERFPDDWIYLFSKTGEDGADMWEEISRQELPKSKVFVVFWSRNHIKAKGCVREILQAKDLVAQRLLRPLILRLDDCPLSWTTEFAQSDRPVFEALGEMLWIRASQEKVTIDRARELVTRAAELILRSNHPRMRRPDLEQALRQAIQKDRYSFYPAAWVSGFNGVGRESLTREFNRSFVPNGRGIVVEVNEASLPRQVLLEIESEALGADHARLLELSSAQITDETGALAETIERVYAKGDYMILRHSRIVEESVELPEWLDDVVNALSPSTRTKLFIISQLPLMPDRRIRCRDAMVSKRVPTVDEHDLTEFCHQLIGHFDSTNPNRWTDEDIEKVVGASGGTLGFLVSLVRSAANMDDLDHINALIDADSERMAEAITVYVRWAYSQLDDLEDEKKTLLFLNDVSPCDIVDIEQIVLPSRPMLRVIDKLLELGLVERQSDSLYRLTPLLANRLQVHLLQPTLVKWLHDALKAFAKRPLAVELEDHEYVRIQTRIQASLWAETEDLPNSLKTFVSAAHWFQAGIRLYHARRREAAYRVIKKAYGRRSEFAHSSRVELMRYFCLSATRTRNYSKADQCIQLLESDHRTKAMAAFLRADKHEYKREFFDAVREYERALELNKGKDRRLERTYRPLIRCILATPKPDFEKAAGYAREYVKFRQTVFSLMSLARVYLHWRFRGAASGRDVPDDIDRLYEDAVADLEKEPGVGSAHFEMRAEEAEFSGDFMSALDYMNQAVEADPRYQLRSARWRLMAKSGDRDIALQALNELDAAKNDPVFLGNWTSILPMLAETYALALRVSARPIGLLNVFAQGLPDGEIGAIVKRVRE